MSHVTIQKVGPQVTVQDLGRPGHLSSGLSRGGAVDVGAVHEGAALLGQSPGCAVLEMAGQGGVFRFDRDTRVALTGAVMSARCGERALRWNGSHLVPADETLSIGGASGGVYGYLHIGGGIDTPAVLGSRAAHLTAGIGGRLEAGARLPLGPDRDGLVGLGFAESAVAHGPIRVAETAQTSLFTDADLRAFEAAHFKTGARATRQSVPLDHGGAFVPETQNLSLPSEIVQPGDIQITGDGTPHVLLAECQATGGYPRIGRVIAPDLARVAQTPPGGALRFEFIDRAAALAALRAWDTWMAGRASAAAPLVRDPADIGDLLSYNLVGGVISAKEDP